MRRREFIGLLRASATLPFAAAVAQQARRTYRLGFLLPLARDAPVNVAFMSAAAKTNQSKSVAF
jgi:hypothetical protein